MDSLYVKTSLLPAFLRSCPGEIRFGSAKKTAARLGDSLTIFPLFTAIPPLSSA
jgi:hypothetical protein